MDIAIKKLQLTDFLCHKKLELDFTKHSGLTLIYGENGRGKTAIAEAIIFSLYGKSLRDIPLPKIIKEGATKVVCELDFSIDGKEYILKREKHSDKTFYELNGLVITTQEQLEKSINNLPPKEVFQRCMYFGTSLIMPFTGLQQYELKARLCQYGKLDWFEKCLEITRDIINKKIIPLSKNKDTQLGFLTNQNETLSIEAPTTTEIKCLEENIKQNKELIKNEEGKLDVVNNELMVYNKELYSIEQNLERINGLLKIDKCPTCLQEINEELKTNFANIHKITESNAVNLKEVIEKTQKTKKDINLYIKYLTQLIGKNSHELSQCLSIQNYTEKYKTKNVKEIEHLKLILQKLTKLLQRFKKWETIFSWQGIPTSIFKESVLPFINHRLYVYTSILSPKFKPSLKLNARGDIRFELDKTRDFEALSTGQKRIIDLCLSLAVRDFIEQTYHLNINLLFFDEVFDGLDEHNVELLIKTLDTNFKDKKVFSITHRIELQHYFKDIIYVSKEGVSKCQ